MATTETAKADRSKTIEVGDFVTFGDNKLTYEVKAIHRVERGLSWALCESGQSGRRIGYYLHHIKLWKKAESNVD